MAKKPPFLVKMFFKQPTKRNFALKMLKLHKIICREMPHFFCLRVWFWQYWPKCVKKVIFFPKNHYKLKYKVDSAMCFIFYVFLKIQMTFYNTMEWKWRANKNWAQLEKSPLTILEVRFPLKRKCPNQNWACFVGLKKECLKNLKWHYFFFSWPTVS